MKTSLLAAFTRSLERGRRATLRSGILMLALSAAGAFGAGPAVPARITIDALAWLTGTWSFERNGRVVTERWTPPAGGVMLGTSHTVAKEKTVEYEFVIIRPDENGDLCYVASPSGQPGASFKLARRGEREVVFENKAHDFPRRISYALQADGTLLAAIEGEKNGKSRRVEFPYRRVK